MFVRQRPQPREDQVKQRIDQDRVRHGEKTECSGAVDQGRDGYEGVGGIQIATEQEPGDEGAEAAAAEAPLVQLGQVAGAPPSGPKAQSRDEKKERDEYRERGPVHGDLPNARLCR